MCIQVCDLSAVRLQLKFCIVRGLTLRKYNFPKGAMFLCDCVTDF